MKRYEVLKGLPPYGKPAIPMVPDGELFVSEGFVVKFYKEDGNEWIGNFPKGVTDLFAVRSFDTSQLLLIISGGDGYLIDPNKPEVLKYFDYMVTEMLEWEEGKLILASYDSVTAIDKSGHVVWKVDLDGSDGVKDLYIDDHVLFGKAYDIYGYEREDPWVVFYVDLITQELTWVDRYSRSYPNLSWWQVLYRKILGI
jgi:hypothetical protein